MTLKLTRCEVLNWIHIIPDRFQLQIIVNVIINFWVNSKDMENLLIC